jgi:hypothetical protein
MMTMQSETPHDYNQLQNKTLPGLSFNTGSRPDRCSGEERNGWMVGDSEQTYSKISILEVNSAQPVSVTNWSFLNCSRSE